MGRLEVQAKRTGDAIDEVAGPRVAAEMEALARQQQGVREEFERTERSVGDLQTRLDRLGRTRARPSVGVDGFDRVNAQIAELERRLDRFDRRRVNVGLSNIAGGGGSGGGGFRGMTGGGGGGRAPTLFSAIGGLPGIGLGAVGASPGVLALLGSAVGVAGSAASAGLGAGTVGLGGLGAFAAGAGLTAVIAKPAIAALGDVTKAQTAYNVALQEYGRRSSEAHTAAVQLNYALAQHPMAAGVSRQLGLLERDFSTATRPAQANVYQGVSGVLANARRGVRSPAFGQAARVATGATSSAAISYSGFLTQEPQLATLGALTREFAVDLPIAEKTLENLTTTAERLAVAATPFFHQSVLWVERWSAGLASSTADTDHVQSRMRQYVNSAKDWARLAGAAARDVKDIFEAGAPSGDSMVVQLTQTLNRWDRWIDSNPQKVTAFFQQSKTITEEIATTVGHLLTDVEQLANYLSPIFSRLMQLTNLASGLGGGNLLLGGSLLYGAYRGVTGGRGPSPGGLASSFIFGGTGGLRRGGATTPAAAASVAGRATDAEVAAGRTAGGVLLMGSGEASPGLLSRAGGLGMSALAGVGRVAAPLLALQAIQGLAQPTSGGVEGRLTNMVSGLTFGIVPQYVSPTQRGQTAAQTFLQGLNPNASPTRQMQAIEARLAHLRTPAAAAGGGRTVMAMNRFGQTGTQVVGGTPHAAQVNQAQIAALTKAWNQAWQQQVQASGGTAAAGWEDAFTRALDRGEGPKKAVATMLSGMKSQLHELGPAGSKAFAGNMAQWAAQMEEDNPKLRRPLERVLNSMVGDLNRMDKTTGSTMLDLQNKIFYFNGQILQGSQKTWGAIGDALTNPAQIAQEKLVGIFGQIQSEAINALVQMGFSGKDAKSLVTGLVSGNVKTATVGQAVQARAGLQAAGVKGASGIVTSAVQLGASGFRHATGGRIPGVGTADVVRMSDGGLAAPGELVLNHWTESDVNRDLMMAGKRSLGVRVAGETRPHYVRRAVGGRTGAGVILDPGVNMSYGQEPQILQDLHAFANEMREVVYVISGYRSPAHSVAVGGFADDPHTQGRAADVGLGSPTLASMYSVPESALRAVGLWRPFYPGSRAEANHVQLLSGGARGAAGLMAAAAMQIGALRAPASGFAGVPGALADRGGQILAAAMTGRINQTLATAGGGGMNFAGVPGTGGSATANQQLGRAMMLAAGWGADQWPSLQALWTQESGWSSNAVNRSSGAYGIPQSLGHGHPYALGDARAQIAWGLNYIRSRYGSPAGAEAHERSFNWYGGGTDQVVTRPSLFGAGESGPERVQITPVGRGGGGINIARGAVQINAAGGDTRAMQRYVDKRLRQFAQDVADEIEAGAEMSHHGAIG